jgi:hypothetical protein
MAMSFYKFLSLVLIWAVAYTTGTVWAELSVFIDADSYDFGAFEAPSSEVSTSTIRVINDSFDTPATWSLRASTITAGSLWKLVNGPMVDSDDFRLSAAFHDVQPSSSSFSADDRLILTDQTSSSTAFSIDGSSTGVAVPVGASRNIWFLMETPLSSGTTEQQLIQITVTAGP